MNFNIIKNKLAENFATVLADKPLFEVDANKDALWELYLNSFPEGTNPIFRVRREYDCSCCRHFIKDIGGTVYFDEELNVHSIFEFDTGSPVFQPVMDALDSYIKSCPIKGVFLSKFKSVGTDHSTELYEGSIIKWEHFFVTLPDHLVHRGSATMDTAKSQFRDTHNVFRRTMNEISLDAIDTVNELIRSNTLYKGEEWAKPINELRCHKVAYEQLSTEKRVRYCWNVSTSIGITLGRIRNHSIGVLLTDISSGEDLDAAVRRYEKIVAPANYKRPKAIFTKKMLEEAQKTITELGYLDSLPRRFATLDDIRVNNILFSNKDAAKRIGGSVFDEMLSDVKRNPKEFSRAEEISIDKFVSDVLPLATEVEAFVENRHEPNLVSLIAPQNMAAKTMFKWGNGFSWAYTGNMTDSDIRENVKSAGGSVDGVLRFSIQWNDMGDYDGNDVDAHCRTAAGEHIYYGLKSAPFTGGSLDVDIIHPVKGKPAVENITWANKRKMVPGKYRFSVDLYSDRGGKSGFRAEIEFDGQIYSYNYAAPLRHSNGEVAVADVILSKDGKFTIKEHLASAMSSREFWGVKTMAFVPVSVIMYSPNYWDEQQGIGHRHYLFMLKDCINPESPNGFYNEFLRGELTEHKRVFEALGSKMSVAYTPDQLSGLGFSSTKRNELIVKVKGATERIFKIKF